MRLTNIAVFLEREAGYQLISLFLIVFGMILMRGPQQEAAAHDLFVFGLGVLARSMVGELNKQMSDKEGK